MKKIDWPVVFCVSILVGIVALLNAQGAFGQTIPQGLIVKPVDPFVAIMETKPRATQVSIDQPTPQANAEALTWAIGQTTPGQSIRLAETTYDFGPKAFITPAGKPLIGRGKGKTLIVSTQDDQRHSCGMEIKGRGLRVSHMTVAWRSKDGVTRGGQAVGIADPANPGNTEARFEDVAFESEGGCALYYWGGGKQHLGAFVDCDFSAGRFVGCLGAGSGDDSAILTFERCTFNGDFAKWGGAGGDMGTPSNTTGFVQRGGRTSFEDCTANVVGFPGTGKPNDPNGPPFELTIAWANSSLGDRNLPKYTYKWPYMDLNRCTANVKLNGAKKAIDVWGYNGTTKVNGGKGSNADGSFVVEGSVAIAP